MRRRPDHRGAREHPPPPLPVDDAGPVRGVRPVRLARRALPGLGTPRRRGRSHWSGSPSSRSPAARPRPTITTWCRAATTRCSTRSWTPRGRSASASTWRAARWTSASLGRPAPDYVVEDIDAILASTESVIARHHDGERVVVTVAPCSPFSVTPELMRESAALARRHGLRLHTHLAETVDEERDVLERFGRRPVDLLDDLGWIDRDVWVAHGIHFDDAEVARLGAAGTGVAHCPSSNARLGAGMCRGRPRGRGVPVGLGVDGAASNEVGGLQPELRQALYTARQRAGRADVFMPPDALRLATEGGARASGGTTSACSNPATGPTWWCGPATISRTSPTRSRDWSSVPIGERGTSWSRDCPSSATVCSSGRTKVRSAETWPNAPVGCGPERVDMPLQNRVTPLGDLVAEPGRGLVYGNRGCLHDERGRIRRRFNGKRWIACRLRFRGGIASRCCNRAASPSCSSSTRRPRSPRGIVRALCRREDYVRFGRSGASCIRTRSAPTRSTRSSTRSGSMRIRARIVCTRRLASPDGAFVLRGDVPFVVVGDELRWTTAGYVEHTETRSGPNDAHHTPIAGGGAARRLASGRPAAPSIGGAGRRDGITAASGGATDRALPCTACHRRRRCRPSTTAGRTTSAFSHRDPRADAGTARAPARSAPVGRLAARRSCGWIAGLLVPRRPRRG